MSARCRLIALFRGRCVGYAVIRLSEDLAAGTSDGPGTAARVILRDLELTVPVFTPPALLSAPADVTIRVIAFPLLAGTARCEISLLDRRASSSTPLLRFSVSGAALAWHSKKNYALRRDLAVWVRDVERAYGADVIGIDPIAAFPLDEESYVLRLSVRIPETLFDHRWRFGAFVDGTDASADLLKLRDGISHDDGADSRRIVLSLRLPLRHENAWIHVGDAKGDAPGFAVGVIARERDGMLGEFFRLTEDAKLDARYPAWLNQHSAGSAELARQRAAIDERTPLVSIVVPLFEPDLTYLRAAINSVLHQSYAGWELILVNGSPEDAALGAFLDALDDERIVRIDLERNRGIVGNTNAGIATARGEFVSFLDQDDLLLPEALYRYVETIRDDDGADLLYCDEDSVDAAGAHVFAPLLKPDFNRDLLYSHNYIVHFLMVSRWALERIELPGDEVNGAQDYDLTLRVSEVARSICHIPHVLYHWRQHAASSNAGNEKAKPYAVEAGLAALRQHFARRALTADVSRTEVPYVYRPTFEPPADRPLVSIVIPNRDHVDYLSSCIRSLLARAGYERFEILIVENGSAEPATFSCYERLSAADARIRVVVCDDCGEDFNYSRIINFGVSCARGSHLLLLNNDTEVISERFLSTMLGYFQRPEVGVVGAQLLYRDGLIQHAGIALLSSQRLGFMNQNHSLALNKGYLGSSSCGFEYSAVLGACQMTTREIFQQAGGYCEELARTYNDIDFCWSVRALGFSVVCTPYASLYHLEYGSRDTDRSSTARAVATEREAGIMKRRWPAYFALGDPCINPNCDRDSAYFKLGV